MTNRSGRSHLRTLVGTLGLAMALLGVSSAADASVIPLNTIIGTTTDTFEGLPGGNVAGFIAQVGAMYGERFAGQILATGVFDTLTPTPTNPLTLVANPTLADNIGILSFGGSNTIYGDLGGAVGEGALSILLTQDSTVFGLNIVGTNAGTFTAQFFARNGTLLASLTQPLAADGFFGFQATGGDLIAGISITNTDPAGVAYDNVTFNQAGNTAAVPEPGSLALVGIGLARLCFGKRRKTQNTN